MAETGNVQSGVQSDTSEEKQSLETTDTPEIINNETSEQSESSSIPVEQHTDPVACVGQELGGVAQGGMSVVVIGGTGAIGRALVSQLLANKTLCDKVTVFGRRDINQVLLTDTSDHEGRLIQHIGDLDALTDDDIKTKCNGANVFFSCLGTTRSAAGSSQMFYHIEHDIVMKFARQAKEANISHFSLVSSYAANHNSMFHFLRTKGQVEQSVLGLGFSYTTILRPVLLGRGFEARFAEKAFGFILRAIPVETVSRAMINDAYQYYQTNNDKTNHVILANADIYRIAATTEASTD